MRIVLLAALALTGCINSLDLGYPLRISVEGKKNVADAGVVDEARNLQRVVIATQ